jgi:AcrR family transcriptional regulator
VAVRERKERDRARRHRLIVSSARELAEREGWDAVTTRRLAERIEYSQPVLYSHFAGKVEIVRAVALEGFAELTAELRRAVPADTGKTDTGKTDTGKTDTGKTGTGGADLSEVRALAGAYLEYARRHPAVYEAMFQIDAGLVFAADETPEPLRAAFDVLLDTLRGFAGDADPGVFTEVAWSSLHGMVVLTRAGRMPAGRAAERLDVLAGLLAGPA